MPASLERNRHLIDAEMRAVLGSATLPIYDMARYHLGWQEADGAARENGGGKGLRPALSLLTAESVARAADTSEAARLRALPGAAAVEFVHSFSLVHDDIQDGDAERHHRPTVWKQWGVAQGINVGDALRELAQLALERAREAGVSADAVLDAHRVLNTSSLEMIEGQYLDLSFEGERAISVDDYLGMIERKTGAMIGCALSLGALLGCEDRELAERLNRAGRRLGLCFQIRDDYLGIWGDSAATGKSSDNDIRRRKKSYPIVYAFEQGGGEERATLERIYARAQLSDADVESVLGVLLGVNARDATEHAAQQQHDAFRREIDACDLRAEGRAAFGEIADFVLRREH